VLLGEPLRAGVVVQERADISSRRPFRWLDSDYVCAHVGEQFAAILAHIVAHF
jgi:hypothetical protein